jgi:hypothetical protein
MKINSIEMLRINQSLKLLLHQHKEGTAKCLCLKRIGALDTLEHEIKEIYWPSY